MASLLSPQAVPADRDRLDLERRAVAPPGHRDRRGVRRARRRAGDAADDPHPRRADERRAVRVPRADARARDDRAARVGVVVGVDAREPRGARGRAVAVDAREPAKDEDEPGLERRRRVVEERRRQRGVEDRVPGLRPESCSCMRCNL